MLTMEGLAAVDTAIELGVDVGADGASLLQDVPLVAHL